jgi:hypothetical protein
MQKQKHNIKKKSANNYNNQGEEGKTHWPCVVDKMEPFALMGS